MANKCPTCHSDNPETLKFCADCGTQLPLPQGHRPVLTETLQTPVRELTTGSTFAGRYQVIEELGHGGMGSSALEINTVDGRLYSNGGMDEETKQGNTQTETLP